MKEPPLMSTLDGIGNALGYSIVLVFVGFFRELFGSGSLMGFEVFTTVNNGGWFQPDGMFLLAPMAFFLIGFFIWGLRTWKPEQVESED
jgi:Na+-transporting NADH:ubiquinone oxidoreductase subunit D